MQGSINFVFGMCQNSGTAILTKENGPNFIPTVKSKTGILLESIVSGPF